MKNFFQKLDHDLLLNRPNLWATQLHLFLPIYVCILGATYLIGLTFPVSTATIPDVELHFLYAMIFSGIIFLVWAYKASQFQATKQFGNTNFPVQFQTQLIYLAVTFMLAAVPFVYSNALVHRIKNVVSAETLTNDCNTLNIGNYYLQNFSYYDSETGEQIPSTKIDEERYANIAFNLYGYEKINSAEENMKLIAKDKNTQMLQIEAFVLTLEKYGYYIQYTPAEIYDNFVNREYNIHLNGSEGLEDRLYRISKAQQGGYFIQDAEFYNFSFFSTFVLGILLFILAATSLRTFLISVVTGFVGFLAASLCIVLTIEALDIHGNNREQFFSLLYLATTASLIIFGVSAGKKSRTLLMREVALSLAAALMPFTPIAASILVDWKLHKYDYETQMYIFHAILFGLLSFISLGTWFIWNILFRPALLKIQTIPTRE